MNLKLGIIIYFIILIILSYIITLIELYTNMGCFYFYKFYYIKFIIYLFHRSLKEN